MRIKSHNELKLEELIKKNGDKRKKIVAKNKKTVIKCNYRTMPNPTKKDDK